MRRRGMPFVVSVLVCAACAGQGSSAPPAKPPPEVSIAKASATTAPSGPSQPPAAPPQTFTGTLRADGAVTLADDGSTVRMSPIYEALATRKTMALACMTGGEKKAGLIWLVGRVATSGALEAFRSVETHATDAQTSCVADALRGVTLEPRSTPLALSMTLRYAPIPAPGEPPPPEPAATDEEHFNHGMIGLLQQGGGTGIGVGGIGSTLAHGSGTGVGQGYGSGHGRLGGAHAKTPKVRMGATAVSGRLPPEVIQRIVRQQFRRYQACYETGLRTNPNLRGRITVEFTIGTSGAVTATGRGKDTDLSDPAMVACVLRTFAALSFPAPEGGIVTVRYPLLFAADDGSSAPPKAPPPKAPPRPPLTVQKTKVVAITGKLLALALGESYPRIALVPIADANAVLPFALFVRQGDAVYVVRRVHDVPGLTAAIDGIERIGPDGWGLRVEGERTQRAGEILDFLID